MYVTGIQPVGGRGVGGVQPLVAVPRTTTTTDEATTAAGARAAASGQMARNLAIEGQAVVFPRGGPNLDWRPVDVRRREAEDRYREANDLLGDDDDETADDEHDDPDRFVP